MPNCCMLDTNVLVLLLLFVFSHNAHHAKAQAPWHPLNAERALTVLLLLQLVAMSWDA